ncbi:hypothetical protein D3C80_975950 [compost metagenome]
MQYHGAAVAHLGGQVEHEVRRPQRPGIHPAQGDAGVRAQGDDGIALTIACDLQAGEVQACAESDQIQPVGRHIEAIDLVVGYGLGEHKGIGTGRAAEVVILGQRKDRRAGGVGFHVVGDHHESCVATGVGPGLRHLQRDGATEVSCCGDRQCGYVVSLHRPGTIAVVDTATDDPAHRHTDNVHRDQPHMIRRIGKREIDRLARNTSWGHIGLADVGERHPGKLN